MNLVDATKMKYSSLNFIPTKIRISASNRLSPTRHHIDILLWPNYGEYYLH